MHRSRHLWGELSHLGDAAGVVAHGAVRIDGEAGGEGGQHTDRGERDACSRGGGRRGKADSRVGGRRACSPQVGEVDTDIRHSRPVQVTTNAQPTQHSSPKPEPKPTRHRD